MGGIVTLTLNPALDVSTSVEAVVHDRKLRCGEPQREPGGGGINVARAVRHLGGDALAVWTRGGHIGRLLGDLLDDDGVLNEAVPIEGTTRESLMVYEESTGQQYRFLFPGPTLTEADGEAVHRALTERSSSPHVLVLSGSLPPDAPDDTYARIAAAMSPDVKVVVDTHGDALRRAIEAGVFLVKPNVGELRSLVGRDLLGDAEIERAAEELLEGGGTQVVAVSLGAGGAIVVTRDGATHVRSPTVPIRSRVGAGDSMVAGTVLGLERGLDPVEAVRFGVACGAAAVMTPGSELCRRQDAERLYASMKN